MPHYGTLANRVSKLMQYGMLSGSFVLAILLFQAERRSSQIKGKTEHQLIAELQAILMDGVALAALEYPEICDDVNGLDP